MHGHIVSNDLFLQPVAKMIEMWLF